MVPPTSVNVTILTVFALVYGWILHEAARVRSYRIVGVAFIDIYILPWLMGFVGAFTPLFLYLGLGFDEFAPDADGKRLLRWLHWAGRAQIILFVLYGVLVLTTVRQRSAGTFSLDDLQGVIVANIIFALIAIFFLIVRGLLDRVKR